MVQERLENTDDKNQNGLGERPNRKGVQPSCTLTSVTENLLRFVDIGDGTFHYDPFGKLEGKHFYLVAEKEILKQHYDAQGFGQNPPYSFAELLERITNFTQEKIYQYIGLCKKTGFLISGFTKVKIALENRDVNIVIVAQDAQASDIQKIQSALKGIPLHFWGEQSVLSRLLNKENVVYLGFKPSELTNKLKNELEMLENLRKNENHAI